MKLDSAIFYTTSINKIANFYTNLIELKVEYRDGDDYVSFLFDNGVRLGIKKANIDREKVGSQSIIVQVENIEDIYQKLRQKDINFCEKLSKESWGITFSIFDLDNNKIEFLERS